MASFASFSESFFETIWTWVFPSIFKLFLIIVIAAFIKFFIDVTLDNFVSKFKNIKRAQTLRQILTSTSKVIIVTIALMMILNELSLDIRPIIASAGILGVAFSLGAQQLMKDIINGFFILLEDQFGIGDTIKIGDISGTVEKMNLRTTTIVDTSGNTHIIPNSQINQVSVLKHI
jgi:small-conductance mechanosensitive channel